MDNIPISLEEYKKAKTVKALNPRLDQCLEDLRYIINSYDDINPVIVLGIFATYTGRLVGMADPLLATDLLEKTKQTIEIFALREVGKTNGTQV